MTEKANMAKIVLLNFDLEEFNLPLEYGVKVSRERQFEFSFLGLKKLLELLDKYKIKSTFFTTASFSGRYPKIIRKISKNHEIASHGLHHDIKKYDKKETEESKKIIEGIIKKRINGFRFPRLQKIDFNSLKKIGFDYDSSVCPTYLPGRYNNYFEKREITKEQGIIKVPISTMRIFHFPLYWIFFRNFGLNYSKVITNSCMKNPGFTNIFFHPWEFNDLSGFNIPFYIRKNSGDKAIKILANYIDWCKKKNYKFSTIISYLKELNKL